MKHLFISARLLPHVVWTAALNLDCLQPIITLAPLWCASGFLTKQGENQEEIKALAPEDTGGPLITELF